MTESSRLREELLDRRNRLEEAIAVAGEADDLVGLIRCVDEALSRLDGGGFGTCVACRETVEEERLLDRPLLEYCLCDLSRAQQEALQRDLDLATRTQWALLPKQDLSSGGWRIHHRYLAAGPVSGDYCDVVAADGSGGPLFFIVGDVAGKGVAAAFLMARLHALFRTLIDSGVPLQEMMTRANRLFGESNMPAQYATLVCGQALPDGRVAICNAGHPPPILASASGEVRRVEVAGLPVGLFATGPYSVSRTALAAGDTLVLYSDGLTEARDGSDREFGAERLMDLLRSHGDGPPAVVGEACLREVRRFLSGKPLADDLTLMVVRRLADEA